MVRVWRVDLRRPPEWIEEAAASLLAGDEREPGRDEIWEVWRRRVAARAALRIALSRSLACPPRTLRFQRGPNGKPELTAVAGSRGELHFNLTRSGDCCLIAVSSVGPIGIDVERVVAFPEMEEIVRRRFAPPEAAAIGELSGDRRVRAFYNCWTRKEAYLKARGVGLAAELDSVVVSVDDERPAILSLEEDDRDAWSIAGVDLGPGMVGAVALNGAHELPGGAVKPSVLPLGLGTAPGRLPPIEQLV
jgi:4'-phosphopantetheinyl transferase